ncbi:Lipoprotein signal peptidase [Trichinella spiralis]|uniref:Lipoprotein signal peptidase n=1 Tax=Trichinella spiralis TaxID=6334 RepID=A0ABR3K790_TRISP
MTTLRTISQFRLVCTALTDWWLDLLIACKAARQRRSTLPQNLPYRLVIGQNVGPAEAHVHHGYSCCQNTFKCHDQRCTTDEHIADRVECRMYCYYYAVTFEDGVV